MTKILKRAKRLHSVKGTKYSAARDKKRTALPPGKRKSSGGSIYYERRRNRADRDKRRKL